MTQYFDDDAMMEELLKRQGSSNTGVTGYMDPAAPVPPPEAAPVQAPAQPAPRQTYEMGGFEASKLNDPTHNTEKYQIGRVFQYHDPSKGITPELLRDLNALGIGDFSGSGDRLTLANARNGNRLGAGTGDVIQNYTGEGPKRWTYLDTEAREAPAAAGLMPGPSGSPIAEAYRAFPQTMSTLSRIQSLLPTDLGFYNKLQTQVQNEVGGPSALQREALLRLLGNY